MHVPRHLYPTSKQISSLGLRRILANPDTKAIFADRKPLQHADKGQPGIHGPKGAQKRHDYKSTWPIPAYQNSWPELTPNPTKAKQIPRNRTAQ